MKKSLFAALLGGLALSSCSSDDDITVVEPTVEIPTSYSFSREGSTSVSYSGQTTRLEMSKELFTAFNDFDNATEESLSNMFANENNPFSSDDLNSSSKSVKSKVAASQAYFSGNSVESNDIKNEFEGWISQQVNEVFPNKDQVAAAGVAGQIADGSNVRYVNAQGLELNQVFAKSLIGGLVADQMLNNYLSTAVLDEGDNIANNDAKVLEDGKNYTTMEHKWDEAYGYLYGDPSIPTDNPNNALGESNDKLLFNYLGRVDADDDFAGIAEDVFEAFKTGRAAIVAGDYELRDEQTAIIQKNISKVIAVRAVYYLQGGKEAIANGEMGSAFHDLSEGFGFLYSLRFTHDPVTNAPYLSKSELDTFKEQLLAGENGLWDVEPATLDAISESIAEAFDFTVAEAAE
ncbi:DUF4856 domain-containing protein [Salinimicrobium sediminilitoris]|uniref:DUF4856 domain-containing protein n=1 Tax=Salinimicrobium sediminilitoris TaxID=2876715 RepID=UPI001E419179|nr:DUF4856 domain-containing protein [Salinimicrobium sediminilitoris]MCC8358581.1 DUF4856 domain-containing protein [Salinimicrobium sediminilitoris]